MSTRKTIVAAIAACGLTAGIGGDAIAESQNEDPNVPPAVVDGQGNSPDGSRRVVADEGDGKRSVTYFDPPSEDPGPDGSRRVVADEGDGKRSVTYFDPPSEDPGPDGSRRVLADEGDGKRSVTYFDPPSEDPGPDGSRRVVADEGDGKRSVTYFDPPSGDPAAGTRTTLGQGPETTSRRSIQTSAAGRQELSPDRQHSREVRCRWPACGDRRSFAAPDPSFRRDVDGGPLRWHRSPSLKYRPHEFAVGPGFGCAPNHPGVGGATTDHGSREPQIAGARLTK